MNVTPEESTATSSTTVLQINKRVSLSESYNQELEDSNSVSKHLNLSLTKSNEDSFSVTVIKKIFNILINVMRKNFSFSTRKLRRDVKMNKEV